MSDDTPHSHAPLSVVLCWHMHQPEYRDRLTGEYQLPWTYLHAIKDYVDMAVHLETVPGACAVVNFAPVLLDQIADYAGQLSAWKNSAQDLRDPLLAALVAEPLPTDETLRRRLINACMRANEQRLIGRFSAYQRLADIAAWTEAHPDTLHYLSDQYLIDVLMWYHLAWLGETVRRSDERVQRLIEQESHYSLADRHTLMTVIGELLNGVIARYRALAESGRIELSMSPYAHPIVPLLLDMHSAREAMPVAKLPKLEQYPGGEARARWHLERGLETFQRYFAHTPVGCWPSEGGVSEATLRLLGEYGFRWTASGGSVLGNSLARSGAADADDEARSVHRVYRTAEAPVSCFFRDDTLSDLIGFTYSEWHADDAVANLVHHLENIAEACQAQPGSVVSIILDGENAWEHYPENGYYFLSALYARLAQHPDLRLTTFRRHLDAATAPPRVLPTVVAGSWVYGTFSTWIGDQDKNRGWDLLGDAKQCYDRVLASGCLDADAVSAATEQLAICEGSDWCWWFGDYNPASTVSDFERLYRLHLSHLYQLLGEVSPDYLSEIFTQGRGAPATGGVMRPGRAPE